MTPSLPWMFSGSRFQGLREWVQILTYLSSFVALSRLCNLSVSLINDFGKGGNNNITTATNKNSIYHIG